MIDLDSIQSRWDRGAGTQADVAALLGEGAALDSGLVDRLNKGLRSASDLQTLFSAVEQLYASKYGRPTTAQRVAADQQLSQTAQAAAANARIAAGQSAANAEAAAQDARLQAAQQVADANEQAVAAQAAVDQFKFSQKAANAIVAERDHKALSLVDQLGDFLPVSANGAPAQELGTEDPQTN